MIANLHIRPATIADAPSIARVHVATWRSTYQGIVPDAYLSSMSVTRNTELWDRILTKDAEQSDERISLIASTEDAGILGFVSGGPARERFSGYDAELYAIYVLQEYQKKGLGIQLFTAFAQHMKRLGYDRLLVWVLTENPARTFYVRLGGQEIERKTVEIGGKQLEEIGYGLNLNEIQESE